MNKPNPNPSAPLCKKCGGKTISALNPVDFQTERKCVECEVQLVEKGGHPYAVKR